MKRTLRSLPENCCFVPAGRDADAFVVVKKDGINYKIFCKDIVCVKAVPRGVQLILSKEEMKIPYLSIKQLLEKLPTEKFLQVHRMCVVNLDYIEYVDTVNGLIRMKNGEQVEIGITYKSDIKKKTVRVIPWVLADIT